MRYRLWGGEPIWGFWVVLGEMLEVCGHGFEVARAFLEAVVGVLVEEALEFWCRVAQQLLCVGYVDCGLEVLQEVFSVFGLILVRMLRWALVSLAWRWWWLWLWGLGFDLVWEVLLEVLRKVDATWMVAIGLGLVDLICAVDVQSLYLLLVLNVGELLRVCWVLVSEVGFVSVLGAFAMY